MCVQPMAQRGSTEQPSPLIFSDRWRPPPLPNLLRSNPPTPPLAQGPSPPPQPPPPSAPVGASAAGVEGRTRALGFGGRAGGAGVPATHIHCERWAVPPPTPSCTPCPPPKVLNPACPAQGFCPEDVRLGPRAVRCRGLWDGGWL